MYDKIIKQILDTEDIPSSAYNKRYIIKRLKELGEKEGYNINDKFRNRLKDEYIVSMLMVIFYHLNLSVIEEF